MTATVTQVWRYPVKAMGGESLGRADVETRGLVGDRWFAATAADGKLASGKNSRRFRRHDEIFGFTASTGDDGVQVRAGDRDWLVGSRDLDVHLSRVFGADVSVRPETRTRHFDQQAVSIVGTATLDWCARGFGIDADPRRLRPNLVVDTTEPFEEEGWLGREVLVGSSRLRVVERVPRCRMIDVAQVGVAARGAWLKPLGARRDACVAVYAGLTGAHTPAPHPPTANRHDRAGLRGVHPHNPPNPP